MVTAPLKRYRPFGSDFAASPIGVQPFNGANLPSNEDDNSDYPNLSPAAGTDDFSGSHSTGPALDLQRMPDAPVPSMTRKSMDGAGKVPPPMAGGPATAAPQMPDDIPDDGDMAALPSTLQGPRPMAGGPSRKSPQQVALESYAALKEPNAPTPPKSVLGKIGSGVLDVLAAKARVSRHPVYDAQLAQYGRQKDDLANQIKLGDAVENIESNVENRKSTAANRLQGIQDRAQAQRDRVTAGTRAEQDKQEIALSKLTASGGQRVPFDTALPPGMIEIPDPLHEVVDGKPKFKAFVDPHHGMQQLTKDQAEAIGMREGEWVPTPKDPLGSYVKSQVKPDPAAQENVANWISVAENPASTPEEKATANAKIKRNQQNLSQIHITNQAAAQPMDDTYIDAVGRYEADPPSPRSANYQKVIAAVKKSNPKWDARAAASGKRALNDFTSGNTSKAIDAINTVAGHLKTLDDAATALKNHDVSALNRLANFTGTQLGTSQGNAVAMYNTIVHRIGPELGKAYGTATEGENNANQSDFEASRGANLIHGAIGKSAELLNGKINALRHRWERTIPGREFDMVSPEAQAVFDHLGGGAQRQPGGNQQGGVQSDMISAQIPGQAPGQIHRAQREQFLKDHPGATVGK